MALKKKDFVEIEFVAKIKETNQIFDTNIKEKAKELGVEDAKPLKVCIGEGMLLKGLDDSLDGKELNKEYEVELTPQNAFGLRNPSLVKTFPINVFLEKNINPYPGLVLDLDGIIARISSVSGGRVLADFNNPLAGKNIVYNFKLIKKIEDLNEKLKVLSEFYLGTDKFELNDKKAVFSGHFQKKAFEELSKKAKELLEIDVEKKEEKKEEKK
jgi:FKBP-type peptidyl-prolyl cis-trans isomerase 2